MESLQANPQFIAIMQKIDRDIKQARTEVESTMVAVT